MWACCIQVLHAESEITAEDSSTAHDQEGPEIQLNNYNVALVFFGTTQGLQDFINYDFFLQSSVMTSTPSLNPKLSSP